jgi:hypothetical protein
MASINRRWPKTSKGQKRDGIKDGIKDGKMISIEDGGLIDKWINRSNGGSKIDRNRSTMADDRRH